MVLVIVHFVGCVWYVRSFSKFFGTFLLIAGWTGSHRTREAIHWTAWWYVGGAASSGWSRDMSSALH